MYTTFASEHALHGVTKYHRDPKLFAQWKREMIRKKEDAEARGDARGKGGARGQESTAPGIPPATSSGGQKRISSAVLVAAGAPHQGLGGGCGRDRSRGGKKTRRATTRKARARASRRERAAQPDKPYTPSGPSHRAPVYRTVPSHPVEERRRQAPGCQGEEHRRGGAARPKLHAMRKTRAWRSCSPNGTWCASGSASSVASEIFFS